MDNQSDEYEVQFSDKGLALPVLIFVMVCTPIVAAAAASDFLDVLRYVVMAEGIALLALYALTFFVGAYRTFSDWHSRKMVTPLSIRLARLGRILACILLVGAQISEVHERLGKDELDYRTPTLQVSLVLLIFAWGFIDRRQFKNQQQVKSQIQRVLEESAKQL